MWLKCLDVFLNFLLLNASLHINRCYYFYNLNKALVDGFDSKTEGLDGGTYTSITFNTLSFSSQHKTVKF